MRNFIYKQFALLNKKTFSTKEHDLNVIFDYIVDIINKLNENNYFKIQWFQVWNQDYSFSKFYFNKNGHLRLLNLKEEIKKQNPISFFASSSEKYKVLMQGIRRTFENANLGDEEFILSRNSCGLNNLYLEIKLDSIDENINNLLSKSRRYTNLNERYTYTYNEIQNLSQILNIETNLNLANDFINSENFETKVKFINWLAWMYDVGREIEWSNFIYFDTRFKSPIHLDSFTYPIRCNIGLYWKDNIVNKNAIIDIHIFVQQIRNILSKLATINEVRDFQKIILRESTKSAIAAIMSRNLSHNIGSHVLSYLKSYLNNIPNTLAKRLLLEVQKIEGESKNEHEFVLKLTEKWNNKVAIKKVDLEDDMEAPFILGLSRFINYLQERQDFIATISTDYIPYFSTISFKDFIYDELNYDYKIRRHKEKNKYKVENILLDHIARSENYHRDDIQIFFRQFNGLTKGHPDLKKLRKFNLDLPGGIIGRQAIFSIIENILRNAAKHGKLIDNHKLKLTLDIQNPAKLVEGKYKEIEDSEYWEFSITDNNHNGTRALPKILKGLAEPYTDPTTGKLMESNKGLKEMRISAAWLRNENVAEINELKPQKNGNEMFPILSVQLTQISTNEILFDSRDFDFEEHEVSKLTSKEIYKLCGIDKSTETNLRYTLYLRKAQKMALITEREFEIFAEDNNKIDIYQNNEWEKFTVEQYRNEKNKNFQVILVDKELNERKKEIERMASTRCIFDISFERLRKTVLDKYNKSLLVDNEYGNNYRNRVFETYLWKWINDSAKEFDKIDSLPEIAIVEPDISRIKGKENDPKRGYIKSRAVNIYSSESDIKNELIVYRNHNDSEKEFEEFKDSSDKYESFRFIEGISGNNSTDRLVRNDDLSNFWYLKMVESALTSVLVFDERIFARLNKSVLENEFKDKENWHKPVDGYMREMMHRKNIHVFNIIKHNQHFLIVDIGNQVIGEIFFNNNRLQFKLKSHIEHDNNKPLYESKEESKLIKSHDFVAIHQGLLDKINDQYWNDDVEEYFAKKIEWLKNKGRVYYESPRKQYENENYSAFNEVFKAHFKQVVHSGRSKPDNLPQDAVFVQYSSVEYALFDCKYSLTELLYSARIED